MDSVLAVVERGGRVESTHLGAAVVCDASGGIVWSTGEVGTVFPRSTIKPLLALALVEDGCASRLALGDRELSLACASHDGTEAHAAVAGGMLATVGRDVTCLECGAHWPLGDAASRELASHGGRPGAVHNACSGKHAGLICLSADLGVAPEGYVRPDHPVQARVTRVLEEVIGHPHDERAMAIDGCSMPTYAVPMEKLAAGFARFGTGCGMSADRARAAERLRSAVAAAPEMLAGDGRIDTDLARRYGTDVFLKMGAEGIMVASLPRAGLGIAVKCRDGGQRGAEAATAALVARFGGVAPEGLVAWCDRPLKNWAGQTVGRLRAVV